MSVEARGVNAAGAATAVRFVFANPLDGTQWLYWDDRRGFAVRPPVPVGEELRLHATSLLEALR